MSLQRPDRLQNKTALARWVLALLFAMGGWMLQSAPASAATLLWTGSGTDLNWSTPANWNTHTVPTSVDEVVFDGTGKTDSIVDNAAAFSGAVTRLTVTPGFTGSILVKRDMTILGPLSMSGGQLDLRGTGSVLTVYGSWNNAGSTFLRGSGAVALVGNGSLSVLREAASFGNVRVGNGLQSYWTFDETTGLIASDSSGGGNTGTLVGGPVRSVSVPSALQFGDDRSLSFNGTGAYVSTADRLFGSQVTVSAWIRLSSTGSVQTILGSCKETGGTCITGNREIIRFRVEASGKLSAGYFKSGTRYVFTSTTSASLFQLNAWYHVTAVFDSPTNAIRIYVNGIRQTTISGISGGGPFTITAAPFIGAERSLAIPTGTGFFGGLMDDMRVYQRLLSPTEITLLARGYPLNRGQGNYALASDILLKNALRIESNATLDVSTSNYALTLSGDLLNRGSFLARQGTVTLTGISQTLTGSIAFWNLQKTSTGTAMLRFNSGDQFTVSGALTLKGTPFMPLLVMSTSQTQRSGLHLSQTATQNVEAVSAMNIDSYPVKTITCSVSCYDSAGNINWTFGGSSVVSGRVFADAGLTPLGSHPQIFLTMQNGSTFVGIADGSGLYSISGLSYPDQKLMTLFLNGGSEKAVTVLLSSASTMTGVNLYQQNVILRSYSGLAPLRSSHLAATDPDSDVRTLIPSAKDNAVSIAPSTTLRVWPGTTYGSGSLRTDAVALGGTLTMGSQALTIVNGLDASGGRIVSTGDLFLGPSADSSLRPGTLSTFQNLHITDGLVGYWKLDETATGSTAIDASGYANDGTGHGSTGIVLHPSQNLPSLVFSNVRSLAFDGTDDYVDAGSGRILSPARYTVSAWVYPTDLSADQDRAVVCNATAAGVHSSYCLGFWRSSQNSKQLYAKMDDATGSTLQITDPAQTTENAWHHIAASYDGTTFNLYKDGVLVASQVHSGNPTASGGRLAIGSEGGSLSLHPFLGNIDDVRLYARVLSANEISRLAAGYNQASASTLALSGALTLGGNLHLATGRLDLSNNALTVNGSFYNDGTLVLRGHESVLLSMDVDSGDIEYRAKRTLTPLTLGNSYYNVSFIGSGSYAFSNTATVAGNLSLSGVTLDQRGRNLVVTGTLTSTGTILALGSEGVSIGSTAMGGDVVYSGTGTYSSLVLGSQYRSLTISGSGTYQAPSALTVDGTFALNAGTFIAPNSLFTVAGDFIHRQVANFIHNDGTVAFNGDVQTFSGSTVFSRFRKITGTRLSFAGGSMLSTEQGITLLGQPGILLQIRPLIDGVTWFIHALGSRAAQYLDVYDSYNTDIDMYCDNCTDHGGNVKWVFTTSGGQSSSSSSSSSESGRNENPPGGGRGASGGGGRVSGGTSALYNPSTNFLLGSPSIPVDEQSSMFDDVSVNAWYYVFVQSLAEQGVISGYKDSDGNPLRLFGPSSYVGYGELAKFTLGLIGQSVPDAEEGNWFDPSVAQARTLGFSVFTPALDPAEPATRADVIQTVMDALQIPLDGGSTVTRYYDDVSPSDPHAPAIATAARMGLMQGDTNAQGKRLGTFRPQDLIVRAEIAKLLIVAQGR